MTGVASVAGALSTGWINSYHPVPLLDELEYTVSMEVPVDITAVSRGIRIAHLIKQDKNELQPDTDNNFLHFRTYVDDSGLILQIYKEVNGDNTLLASGYDYTMDTTAGVGNLEATIWRWVFNGKPGTPDATMSVYLKQSDTLVNAESATENEVTGSPFDLSDLAFSVGYPSYQIYTRNTTYFGSTYDSANRCASTYLRVKYPSSFALNYDFVPASYGLGEVELFDVIHAEANPSQIYGVEWNQGTDTWRHIDVNGNTITPTTATFNSHPVWGGITRVNLAPDGTVNAVYGGVGYQSDGSNGEVMVRIPKFYIKGANPSANVYQYWISNLPYTDFEIHHAFVQRGGTTKDYLYVGAYEASLRIGTGAHNADTTKKLHTRSGEQPWTGGEIDALPYDTGSVEFTRGETITGGTGGGTGIVIDWYVASGTWANSHAAGKVYIKQ